MPLAEGDGVRVRLLLQVPVREGVEEGVRDAERLTDSVAGDFVERVRVLLPVAVASAVREGLGVGESVRRTVSDGLEVWLGRLLAVPDTLREAVNVAVCVRVLGRVRDREGVGPEGLCCDVSVGLEGVVV